MNESHMTGPSKAAAVTTVGALVASFLASICCIGPLVFAALGMGMGATGLLAGTAGFLKGLLPYRPVFVGLTLLLLSVAFLLAYRRPGPACVPSEVCAPGAASGGSRVLLWVIAALALALVLAPYWLGL